VWRNPVSNGKELDMNYNIQYSSGPYSYMGQAQYRRRGSCLRRLLIFVVVVALLGAGAAFIARNTILAGPTTIAVSAHPTLVIDSHANNGSTFTHDATSIHIQAANTGNKIILQAMNPYGISLPLSIPVPYDRSSDGSTIIIDVDSLQSSRVDITVPAALDLKLYTNSKNIEVDGVSGQVVLSSNSGTITVTHSTLSGSSLLVNNSGAINATQDNLSGPVTFNNNGGSITFNGSIDSNGTYQFQSNSGTIDVTLPRNTSFHLDATANSANNASITSDFPGLPVKKAAIHADVGSPPRALVTLYNNGGSIKLHAQ